MANSILIIFEDMFSKTGEENYDIDVQLCKSWELSIKTLQWIDEENLFDIEKCLKHENLGTDSLKKNRRINRQT